LAAAQNRRGDPLPVLHEMVTINPSSYPLASGLNSISIANVDRSSRRTSPARLLGVTVNLAQGNNTLNLAAGLNSLVDIYSVQHVNGTASADTLTLTEMNPIRVPAQTKEAVHAALLEHGVAVAGWCTLSPIGATPMPLWSCEQCGALAHAADASSSAVQRFQRFLAGFRPRIEAHQRAS
jgi:hypothetical protein